MGSQCSVSFKIKAPYFAEINVSRLRVENGEEKILLEESLSLNSGEEGTIKIHFLLFKLEAFNITTDIFEEDEEEGTVRTDGKMYTISSVADFIFFVLSINASGYFDILNSRPDAFDILRKIPKDFVKIESNESKPTKLNRFCSVKNISCKIEINYLGNDSYFFAYPFDKDEKWHGRMTQLKKEFAKKDLLAVLPKDKVEDIPEYGILFCNICEKILSTNSIIGETTIHNRNVMFEIGYAIGVGRGAYFLVENETKRKEIIKFDLKRINYTSLKEILDNFPQILNKESPLVRPPTITKSCCDKTILELEKSVFLLIPDSQRHQKVLKPALEEVIKDLGYNIIPSIFGHEICRVCESIKKSEYIIGDFVANNIDDNEILNNVIAFYLGLSVAFGKKVIILQEKPHEKRMIDMTGLIKEYVDHEQAQQIIHEILLL
jgi:hypothetical protein